MLKVKFSIIFIALLPLVICASVKRDQYGKNPNNNNNNYRRVGLNQRKGDSDKFFDAFYNKDDFFDSLYNRKGKKHNIGADYGLTSDIYRKPNPFYTKTSDKAEDDIFSVFTKKVNDKTESDFYPVYIQQNNNSVTQDTSGTHSNEIYDHPPPTTYDDKTYISQSSYFGHSAPNSYGAPPKSTYGPPTASYYPASYFPHTSYGPPQSPPSSPSSSYYPSAHAVVAPHPDDQKAHEGLLAKITKKFDLVLMSKLLLKLIIFKKIVKFIAIICLLLFIPTLKKKFEDVAMSVGEDEERKYKILDAYANTDFRVKEIANFALTAIEGFESHEIPWCVGESQFYCRFQYMLDQIDFRYPGYKVLSIWFPHLATTIAPPAAEEPETTTPLVKSEKDVDFDDFITESPDVQSSFENYT